MSLRAKLELKDDGWMGPSDKIGVDTTGVDGVSEGEVGEELVFFAVVAMLFGWWSIEGRCGREGARDG